MTNERNANLDLIKSVACIGVVGLHAVSMNNYTIYYLCDCGVPLFFMVNGYLLLSREQVSYRYAFRKIASILKIVLSWNFLIAIPVLIFRQKMINPFRLAFDSLLQKGYLWHFWFFGALIIIYLLLPILHRLFFNKSYIQRNMCLMFMGVCLCIDILSMIKGYPLGMFVPQPLRLWTWLFYFLSGGLFATQKQRIQQLSIRVHGIFLLCFTIISNISEKKMGLYLIHSRLAEYFYDNLFSIVWYCLLFTFLLRLPLKESYGIWISRFSSLTMGIFIIHPILLFALNALFTPAGTVAAVCFWIGLTLVSMLIGYVMSKIPIARELIKL
ncbi:MAG: acyltransferase family protein [Lachnospiraceae bacterium]|nr:acyltransferase family protein [Lachnospiraceae bacterium]